MTTLKKPVVEVRDLGLAYRLTRQRVRSLKELAIYALRRQLQFETFWALRDVSFAVSRGEVFGIVGHNGAGKTTLMKVIARVLPPSEGRVIVRGRIAPMISLGAGFNHDMSAYENIILYGTILGRDPREIRGRVEAIAEWAGITDFLDVPLRSFSSGMLARLGFAVATDRYPDIMIVDEVLSVGDRAFQERSMARIREMVEGGTSLLFVSHNVESVRAIADRVAWFQHGRLRSIGSTDTVLGEYESQSSTES